MPVPEMPNEEMKPIERPHLPKDLEGDVLKHEPVCVPEMVTHYSKWDYAAMGLRRALKVAVCGAGGTLVIAGIGTMLGLPVIGALKGAGMAVVGTAVTTGGFKIYEEKRKESGKSMAPSSQIIDMLVTAILAFIQAIGNARGGKK